MFKGMPANNKIKLKKKLEPSFIKEKTADIQKQINHLLDTIDSFRKFFRLNESFEHFKVSELIESGIEIVRNQIGSNKIDINLIGNMDAKIYCIKSEFIHTVINFIMNAKDAFDESNWYYLYQFNPGRDSEVRKELVVEFEGDKLKALRGDYETPETFNTPLEQ